MNILGIETTCDETSISLVQDGRKVLHETTISQMAKHQKYGGVVPDLGAREHLTNLREMGKQFLIDIGSEPIDAVAVASKIGLPPAVQVGESYAAGLAKSLGVPLIPVNHVTAHIWGTWIDETHPEKPSFPFMGLIVSGGHTQLVHFESATEFEVIGSTLDDAIGEAFDKVAAMLKLPYPGGPEIERMAIIGDHKAIEFPMPLKDDHSFNFSFSGLKTAVRNYIEQHEAEYPGETRKFFVADVAASFQETACLHIAQKTIAALTENDIHELVIGGGVACNQRLVDVLFQEIGHAEYKCDLYVPSRRFCTDNGSLIAGYAYNLATTQPALEQE